MFYVPGRTVAPSAPLVPKTIWLFRGDIAVQFVQLDPEFLQRHGWFKWSETEMLVLEASPPKKQNIPREWWEMSSHLFEQLIGLDVGSALWPSIEMKTVSHGLFYHRLLARGWIYLD